MIWLILPTLVYAFSSAPSRSCSEDASCVLVKDIVCGAIESVALGQDQAWSNLQAKQIQKMKEKRQECPKGPRPDHRDYEALCREGQCVAEKRTQKREQYIPPPPGAPSKQPAAR